MWPSLSIFNKNFTLVSVKHDDILFAFPLRGQRLGPKQTLVFYGTEQKATRVSLYEFDWRHPDVLRFNIKMIKQLTSNKSHFIVCEATCLNFIYLSARYNILVPTVNIVRIPTCSQNLLTSFERGPDDGHIRTETCSLTHNKCDVFDISCFINIVSM